jgi:hypothetical protein
VSLCTDPCHQSASVDSYKHLSIKQKSQPTEHVAFGEARTFAEHFSNSLCETGIECHDGCSYSMTSELRRSKYSVSAKKSIIVGITLCGGNVDSDAFARVLQQ